VSLFFCSTLTAAAPEDTSDAYDSIEETKCCTPQYIQDVTPISSFTGKIKRNRVRLRLKPHLDAPILKELSQEELIIVTGEIDDFYAVKPTPESKGYIFRSYILDGEVVGSHVNVRLEPDTVSPIVYQYNSGQHVEGSSAKKNNKWLEIAMPEPVRFFVAKEYVNNIGDEKVFFAIHNKQHNLEQKLQELAASIDSELTKPYEEIALNELSSELKTIIEETSDFPELADQAKLLLSNMQDRFVQRSMVEKKSIHVSNEQATPSAFVADNISALEPIRHQEAALPSPLSFKEREAEIIQKAIEMGDVKDETEFYEKELLRSSMITGVVQPYTKQIKNAPGDFILQNAKTHVQAAFLYSTHIDLSTLINKNVNLIVTERPNNHFAHPAFFVLKIEE